MYEVINILDLIEQIGVEGTKLFLSHFSSKDKDIEYFIKNNAIDFAYKKISMTFVVLGENDILGIFFFG